MNERLAVVCASLAFLAFSCSSDGGPGSDAASTQLLIASETVTPGQPIWVAVLVSSSDPASLEPDLAEARAAVGDYLADRVALKEASCFEGLPPEFAGMYVVAIQDRAEHGVHAMYEEITMDPPYYGPATLAC